jgi:hypothetical protein
MCAAAPQTRRTERPRARCPKKAADNVDGACPVTPVHRALWTPEGGGDGGFVLVVGVAAADDPQVVRAVPLGVQVGELAMSPRSSPSAESSSAWPEASGVRSDLLDARRPGGTVVQHAGEVSGWSRFSRLNMHGASTAGQHPTAPALSPPAIEPPTPRRWWRTVRSGRRAWPSPSRCHPRRSAARHRDRPTRRRGSVRSASCSRR